MTTLYHGSYVAVHQPQAARGRRCLDFGQGFYLTNLRTQVSEDVSSAAWRCFMHSTDGTAVGTRGFLVVDVVDDAWRKAKRESDVE